MRERIDKLDFIKIKNFCSLKDSVKKIRKALPWENTFARYISDKGLLFKLNKELLKLNNKKVNNSTKKKKPKTLTDTPPKKICR